MKKFRLSKKSKSGADEDGTVGRSAVTLTPSKSPKGKKSPSKSNFEVSGAAVPYKDPDEDAVSATSSGDTTSVGDRTSSASLAEVMRDDAYSIASGM